jgi:phosphoglycolate phosphatase-like HAD superfamily hydrolase
LVNTPGLGELVEDVELSVHDLDGTLLGNVVKSNNTVRDSLGLQDADPTDFSGVVGVGTAACFGVNAGNIDNSK